MIIKCDRCPGQFNTNATKVTKCPYCGKTVSIRDAVVLPEGTPAGYFNDAIKRDEQRMRVNWRYE